MSAGQTCQIYWKHTGLSSTMEWCHVAAMSHCKSMWVDHLKTPLINDLNLDSHRATGISAQLKMPPPPPPIFNSHGIVYENKSEEDLYFCFWGTEHDSPLQKTTSLAVIVAVVWKGQCKGVQQRALSPGPASDCIAAVMAVHLPTKETLCSYGFLFPSIL